MRDFLYFEKLKREQEKQTDQHLENWTLVGDIVVPSGNYAQVFWNNINWRVAIKFEKEEVGGGKMIILQRAGEAITAEIPGQARIKADEFYSR